MAGAEGEQRLPPTAAERMRKESGLSKLLIRRMELPDSSPESDSASRFTESFERVRGEDGGIGAALGFHEARTLTLLLGERDAALSHAPAEGVGPYSPPPPARLSPPSSRLPWPR